MQYKKAHKRRGATDFFTCAYLLPKIGIHILKCNIMYAHVSKFSLLTSTHYYKVKVFYSPFSYLKQ